MGGTGVDVFEGLAVAAFCVAVGGFWTTAVAVGGSDVDSTTSGTGVFVAAIAVGGTGVGVSVGLAATAATVAEAAG